MKRTSLKRRTRLRSRRDPIVKRLDALCRELIFARDGSCQMAMMTYRHLAADPAADFTDDLRASACTETLDWAHVRSRRFQSTRWSPENSLVLCRKHHMFWHHEPMLAAKWFSDTFPDRAAYLTLAAATPHKIDRALMEIYLREELHKLTEAAR